MSVQLEDRDRNLLQLRLPNLDGPFNEGSDRAQLARQCLHVVAKLQQLFLQLSLCLIGTLEQTQQADWTASFRSERKPA